MTGRTSIPLASNEDRATAGISLLKVITRSASLASLEASQSGERLTMAKGLGVIVVVVVEVVAVVVVGTALVVVVLLVVVVVALIVVVVALVVVVEEGLVVVVVVVGVVTWPQPLTKAKQPSINIIKILFIMVPHLLEI